MSDGNFLHDEQAETHASAWSGRRAMPARNLDQRLENGFQAILINHWTMVSDLDDNLVWFALHIHDDGLVFRAILPCIHQQVGKQLM